MRSIVLTLATVAAGCYAATPPLGAPCSPSGACPTGQQCEPISQTCTLATEPRTWRDDTATDFARPGASFDDAVVEPAGFVGPTPYVIGAVRVAGIAAPQVGMPASTTWEEASAGTVVGVGFERALAIDYNVDPPTGLGLPDSAGVTVLIEGELYFDVPGSWGFELTADDRGFFEIAAPGSGFVRVVSDVDRGSPGMFEVPAPGWYPIRAAFANTTDAMSFDLRYDPPNVGGNFRTIPAERLRAKVADLQGLFVDGFDDTYLLKYSGSTLSTESLADRPFEAEPYGVNAGAGSWTFRWAGQVLIDLEGDYAFQIDSHGHRAWLDGVSIADAFTAADAVTTTSPQHLDPGWHDIVLDVLKEFNADDGHLNLTVASGPARVGEGFPIDHVRPVFGRGNRWVGNANTSTLPIVDIGSATEHVQLGVPANVSAVLVELDFSVNHPVLSTMQVVVTPPSGGNITVAATGSMTGGGGHRQHVRIPPNAGASWNIVASDGTPDLMTGEINGAAVTLVYSGGIAPFPTVYRYTSEVRDLGNVTALGTMQWALRQAPAGASASVKLRTCESAEACAMEPWTDVVAGTTPSVAVHPFAQYQVEITGDGDIPTALDWIELGYSTPVTSN